LIHFAEALGAANSNPTRYNVHPRMKKPADVFETASLIHLKQLFNFCDVEKVCVFVLPLRREKLKLA
jgi:hypothetical protein